MESRDKISPPKPSQLPLLMTEHPVHQGYTGPLLGNQQSREAVACLSCQPGVIDDALHSRRSNSDVADGTKTFWPEPPCAVIWRLGGNPRTLLNV